MADWNPQANEIFLQALELRSAEERFAFLERACAGDAGLRTQVESLLMASDRASSFLESPAPALGALSSRPIDEIVGGIIGPYKLLEQIGEGGMGVVYMAEQETPVRRLVALKIIKPGMDTRQVIARFEAERQALALMDHSNIARVLEAGATDSGRPYFVMELVRGVPITEYCDKNNLPVHERLGLFVQVCHAVQHAHQKGIIHRDLKPTNVLVTQLDGRPVPKVIDFGIAKATNQQLTEKTLFTSLDQMIGTPLYMSPEQAEKSGQDIDTRSDIYSLGVLLYELLTGTTPFEKERLREAAFDEVCRIIREEEPPRPSLRISTLGKTSATMAAHRKVDPQRLNHLVRGDLDWIVMKSLEKDRVRRYETAAGFAEDVLRYLGNQPVEACPPSALYRFRKFARRNRVALTTAVLVSAALVLGTVVSTWQAIRAEGARAAETDQRTIAEEQRKVADQQRAEAEKQREQAEANFQQARQAVDEYFTLVSESKLLDVPGLQPLRKDLLEAAIRFYQKFADHRADDPAAMADLAAAYMRVSVVLHAIDENEDALVAIDKALAIVDRLRREYPDAHEQHRRLAGYWKGYRPTQGSTEMPRNALAAFQSVKRMVGYWEKFVEENPSTAGFQSDLAALYGIIVEFFSGMGMNAEEMSYLAKSRSLLEKLVIDQPDVPEYRADLARTYQALAGSLSRMNRLQETVAMNNRSIALREQLVAENPKSSQYRADLGISLGLAGRYLNNSNRSEAKTYYRRAIELTQPLVQESPRTPFFQQNLSSYISALDRLGELEEADQARRRVIELYEKCATDHPTDPTYREVLAEVHGEFATARSNRPDQWKTAEEMRGRTVEILEKLASEFPDKPTYLEKQGRIQAAAGITHHDAGRRAEAVRSYQKAVEALTRLVATFPDSSASIRRRLLAETYSFLGVELADSKRLEEGEAAFRHAIDIFQELAAILPAEAWPRDQLARNDYYLANLQSQALEHAAAEQSYRQALELWGQLAIEVPSQHNYLSRMVDAYSDLSGLLREQGRLEEAGKLREQADALCDKLVAVSQDAILLNNLAWHRIINADPARRAPETAVKLASKAVRIMPRNSGKHSTLGMAQYHAGQWQEAIDSLIKSEELGSGQDHGFNGFVLALAYWQVGNKEEARKWYDEALPWTRQNRPNDDKLRRYQEEAGQLLGSKEEKK